MVTNLVLINGEIRYSTKIYDNYKDKVKVLTFNMFQEISLIFSGKQLYF